MATQGMGRVALGAGAGVLVLVFGLVVWLLTKPDGAMVRGAAEEAAQAVAEAVTDTAEEAAELAAEEAADDTAEETAEAPREDAALDMTDAPPKPADVEAKTDTATEGSETPEAVSTASADASTSPADTGANAPAQDRAEGYGPMIDVARLSPDGNAVIAGQGAPGTIIRVMVDGQPVYEAEADAGGNFVALFDLPPSDAPRELWLESGAGERVTAAGQVLMILPGEALAMDVEGGGETEAEAGTGEGDAPEQIAAAPRLMLADQDGVKLLDAGAGAAALSLDSISYDAAGAVSIAGRGNGELRLYLNDALIGSALAKAGQWMLTLPESVTPGVYDLRVDAIGADGNVVERIESPFMRESQELLAEAAGAAVRGELAADTGADTEASDGEGEGLLDAVSEAASAVAEAVEVEAEGGAQSAAQNGTPDEAVVVAEADGAEEAATRSDPEGQAEADTGSETEAAGEAMQDGASSGDSAGDTTAQTVPDRGTETPTETAEAAEAAEETTDTAASNPALNAKIITVQPGNTLWAISRAQYGDGVLYVRVFEANRAQIRDPDLIYPGQVFTLPE